MEACCTAHLHGRVRAHRCWRQAIDGRAHARSVAEERRRRRGRMQACSRVALHRCLLWSGCCRAGRQWRGRLSVLGALALAALEPHLVLAHRHLLLRLSQKSQTCCFKAITLHLQPAFKPKVQTNMQYRQDLRLAASHLCSLLEALSLSSARIILRLIFLIISHRLALAPTPSRRAAPPAARRGPRMRRLIRRLLRSFHGACCCRWRVHHHGSNDARDCGCCGGDHWLGLGQLRVLSSRRWSLCSLEGAVQAERLGPQQLVLLHHGGLRGRQLGRRALVQPAVLHLLRAGAWQERAPSAPAPPLCHCCRCSSCCTSGARTRPHSQSTSCKEPRLNTYGWALEEFCRYRSRAVACAYTAPYWQTGCGAARSPFRAVHSRQQLRIHHKKNGCAHAGLGQAGHARPGTRIRGATAADSL